MKRDFLAPAAAVAVAVGAIAVAPSAPADQAPPMGGGYSNVIAIPVDDPATKNIAGALFKPAGAGPFPAVVYMSGCAGLIITPEMALGRERSGAGRVRPLDGRGADGESAIQGRARRLRGRLRRVLYSTIKSGN